MNIEELKTFCEDCTRLIHENNKFKRGWIQSFFDVNTKCKICGFSKMVIFPYPSLNKLFRYKYVHGCCHCGISYVDENINLNEYYKEHYAEQNRKDREISPDVYFNTNIDLLSKYFNRANRHANIIKNIYTDDIIDILDFGSGPGYFLYLINAQNKFAIEPDKFCKKYLDYIGAIQTNLNELPFAKFDIIYSSHSLEHIFINDLTTTTFFNLLKDNGILFFEVPCGNILRYNIHVRHDPHTIFFTPQSLDIVLKNSGFKCIYLFQPSHKSQKKRLNCTYTPDNKYIKKLDYVSSICCIASKIENDIRIYRYTDNYI